MPGFCYFCFADHSQTYLPTEEPVASLRLPAGPQPRALLTSWPCYLTWPHPQLSLLPKLPQPYFSCHSLSSRCPLAFFPVDFPLSLCQPLLHPFTSFPRTHRLIFQQFSLYFIFENNSVDSIFFHETKVRQQTRTHKFLSSLPPASWPGKMWEGWGRPRTGAGSGPQMSWSQLWVSLLRRPPGASPQGGASEANPRGKRHEALCLPLGCP